MNYDEESVYIRKIMQEYVDDAKEDYRFFAKLRQERYSYTTKKGKVRLGSHPKAINKAIKKILDAVHSPDRDSYYEELLQHTNIIHKCNYALTTLSEEGKDKLKDELLKAEAEVLLHDGGINSGRFTSTGIYIDAPKDKQEVLSSSIHQRYYEKTAEEIARDFVEMKKDITSEPERFQRVIEIMLGLVNKQYLIDFTHEDMKKFFDDYKLLPDRNKNRKLFDGSKTPRQIIETAREENIPSIAMKTVGNHMINANAFLNYAVDYDFLDKNRLKLKVIIPEEEDDDRRKEYFSEQLHALFYTSKWYTNELELNLKESPSKVWIPLILLYTGCRLNEIAQIYLDQIIEKEGVLMFSFTDTYEEQKLKNKRSKRKVPIHSKLHELGFLNYVNRIREEGKERLFEDLYYTKDKGYGQAFSKKFNNRNFKETWLPKKTMELLYKEDILLDLHSFRHNFSGSLQGKIGENSVLECLMGHTASSESYKSYGKVKPNVLQMHINKCEYDICLNELGNKIRMFYNSI